MAYPQLSINHPAGNLTLRITSKLAFLELERGQLEHYREFLTNNISFYKEIAKELISHRSTQPNTDELSTVSPRLTQTLLQQNNALRNYFKQVIHERAEALGRVDQKTESCAQAAESEIKTIRQCELSIKELNKESKAKERLIQRLETEFSRLIKTIHLQRDMQKSPETEQRLDLFDNKLATTQRMVKSLKSLRANVIEDNEFLKRRVKKLDLHYDKLNLLLRGPLTKQYDLESLGLPRKDITCDEFWCRSEESILSEPSDTCKDEQIKLPSNMKLLQDKLQKSQNSVVESLLKVQGITHEIVSATVLREQLQEETQYIERLLAKTVEGLNASYCKKGTSSTMRRSNSNPLDYAKQRNEYRSNCLYTEQANLSSDSEVGISTIKDSVFSINPEVDSYCLTIQELSHIDY